MSDSEDSSEERLRFELARAIRLGLKSLGTAAKHFGKVQQYEERIKEKKTKRRRKRKKQNTSMAQRVAVVGMTKKMVAMTRKIAVVGLAVEHLTQGVKRRLSHDRHDGAWSTIAHATNFSIIAYMLQ